MTEINPADVLRYSERAIKLAEQDLANLRNIRQSILDLMKEEDRYKAGDELLAELEEQDDEPSAWVQWMATKDLALLDAAYEEAGWTKVVPKPETCAYHTNVFCCWLAQGHEGDHFDPKRGMGWRGGYIEEFDKLRCPSKGSIGHIGLWVHIPHANGQVLCCSNCGYVKSETDPCGCVQNEAGDIRCHKCGERVNKKCWQCGTPRGEGRCPTKPKRCNYQTLDRGCNKDADHLDAHHDPDSGIDWTGGWPDGKIQ